MILGNYNYFNCNPGREIGGTTNPTRWIKGGSIQNRILGDSYIEGQSERISLYNGYLHPYNLGLPLKAGALSTTCFGIESNGTISSSNLAGGLNAVSALSGMGIISDANMGLILSAVATLAGSGLFTSDIVGKLEAVATIASSGNITGSLGALAGIVIELSGSGNISGTSTAKANIGAHITPFTELSPENLAANVWNTIAADFNANGTMGNKMNLASSGGIDYVALSEAVREEMDTNSTKLSDISNVTVNKVVKEGTIITIYETDGTTVWKQFDLANGGRIEV